MNSSLPHNIGHIDSDGTALLFFLPWETPVAVPTLLSPCQSGDIIPTYQHLALQ